MNIERIDHLVLTVADIERTAAFYTNVLGMTVVTFGAGRTALLFGGQKINLHEAGQEVEPKAANPMPGSADLCFITRTPIREVVEHLQKRGVPMLMGPVERTGAQGALTSIYFRDPDQNLIEVANAAELASRMQQPG